VAVPQREGAGREANGNPGREGVSERVGQAAKAEQQPTEQFVRSSQEARVPPVRRPISGYQLWSPSVESPKS
jgi:hypothetical protein